MLTGQRLLIRWPVLPFGALILSRTPRQLAASAQPIAAIPGYCRRTRFRR